MHASVGVRGTVVDRNKSKKEQERKRGEGGREIACVSYV